MATNRLKVTELDFDTIKTNLKTFLKSQDQFSDYDFEGSGLSVLLDVLSYNTHYNAYYLNMVANEAFLDTAILRDSVVSHAKLIGYTPTSMTAPRAVINLTVATGDSTPDTMTLPRGFTLKSNMIDNTVYNFVLLEDVTISKTGEDFLFLNLPIYEGQLVSYNYTYNSDSNPKCIFTIPDTNVDTTTLKVTVQVSSSNLSTTVYTQSNDVLEVDSESAVYFLQEGQGNKYQIYFGNGSIGKQINDGAIVNVNYLTTSGDAANKSNNFVILSDMGLYTDYTVEAVAEASGGAQRETTEEIRLNSTLQYTSQNRLVTENDYEGYILKSYPSVDSISVWGGETEPNPIFGKILISLKPKENYYLSQVEKQKIIDDIITPKSMISVSTEIRDPDYLFLRFVNKVKYDKKKTQNSPEQIKNLVKNSIYSYTDLFLNKFRSTLVLSKLQDYIDGSDAEAIIGSETTLRLEKRFTPELGVSKSYEVYFNTPLHKGTVDNKMLSSTFQIYDRQGILRTANLEEITDSYTGITSIRMTNPGYGYITEPTVTITGDGFGATAVAKVVNGRVQSIEVTNRGINYTKSVITITGGSGYGASAVAVIDSRYGTLRTVYFSDNAERQTLNSNAGTIDYQAGIISLNNIRIISVDTSDGDVRINLESQEGIVSSLRNSILTIDKTDPTAIITDLIT